ncbi:polysaccharide biosynthesis C-terminal domain-containing protein [Enterococcus hirae]|uniref:lipopolysaccharide biosynthesis protein n=1 Tax=Enterococcus hirae TaxID=1354 RepID=UPI003919A917
MNRYKKLLTSSSILMVGNLGTKFGSLFLLPLYTKYLSTSEYGIADLSITFINLLLPVITMSVFEMFMNDVIQHPTKRQHFLKNVSWLLFFTNMCAWIISHILYVMGYIHIDHSILLLMLILMSLQSYNNLISNFLRSINKNTIYAVFNLVQTILLIALAIIMLQNLKLGLPGYFYANIGAYVVVLLLATPIVFFPKKSKGVRTESNDFKFDFAYLKRLVRKSFPLIPNALMWWGINSADKIFIVLLLGTSASGLFAAANKLPMFITMLSTVFFQAWQVSAMEEVHSENKEGFYTSVFRGFLFLMNLGVLLLYIFLKPIANILFSDVFSQTISYIPFLILAAYFSNLASLLGANCIAEGKTSFVFQSSIFCAVINVILSPIFIKEMGLHGAGISASISFLFLVYIRFYKVRKDSGLKMTHQSFLVQIAVSTIATILFTLTHFFGGVLIILFIYIGFQWKYFRQVKYFIQNNSTM